MTIWICSYPRSGNSLVAASLLTFGLYRYENLNDGVAPDGIKRAILAGRLPSNPHGEAIRKTHQIKNLAEATGDDLVYVPIRDGRDVLVSYWHHTGQQIAASPIPFWEGLKQNGHRWDDWMLELAPHRSDTAALLGFPCAARSVRFEAMAEDLRSPILDGLGLHELDPHHFRSGLSGQWRDLPAVEQDYLNNELGPVLLAWGYT